ncbi:hypothetical protein JAAARDRAFT_198657 [Jaapia argillacea MUCL 33604]|uniref:Uncharacterized protein n=1 Tax=Jaapia argillacea MUCL 33604 TaxID=933084 RepID=A0A067PDV6_9AGAM|nr:hypothetical protein JAAARDRAFT_198657 [Jaapia argillacea MUCL 33604]
MSQFIRKPFSTAELDAVASLPYVDPSVPEDLFHPPTLPTQHIPTFNFQLNGGEANILRTGRLTEGGVDYNCCIRIFIDEAHTITQHPCHAGLNGTILAPEPTITPNDPNDIPPTSSLPIPTFETPYTPPPTRVRGQQRATAKPCPFPIFLIEEASSVVGSFGQRLSNILTGAGQPEGNLFQGFNLLHTEIYHKLAFLCLRREIDGDEGAFQAGLILVNVNLMQSLQTVVEVVSRIRFIHEDLYLPMIIGEEEATQEWREEDERVISLVEEAQIMEKAGHWL